MVVDDKEHYQELIDEGKQIAEGTHPDGIVQIDQPPREWVEEATEEFEAAGFEVESVPFEAIAIRAHALRIAEEEPDDD